MFALFLEHANGQLEFMADVVSGKMTMFLGQRWSERHNARVIAYENSTEGDTRECCRFENGKLMTAPGQSCEEPANGAVCCP